MSTEESDPHVHPVSLVRREYFADRALTQESVALTAGHSGIHQALVVAQDHDHRRLATYIHASTGQTLQTFIDSRVTEVDGPDPANPQVFPGTIQSRADYDGSGRLVRTLGRENGDVPRELTYGYDDDLSGTGRLSSVEVTGQDDKAPVLHA